MNRRAPADVREVDGRLLPEADVTGAAVVRRRTTCIHAYDDAP
jgi:hypothetical protein